MAHYTDLFIDLDDTLYDTQGNSSIALRELFHELHFEQYGVDEELFYDAYWRTNVDLWTRYSKGEITREYLIPERFRRPFAEACRNQASVSSVHSVGDSFFLSVSDRFLELCSNKPGVVDGAHELMDYLKTKGYRMHICSNGFHEVQSRKLQSCGLLDYFVHSTGSGTVSSIILSEDAGVNKPQPGFFEYALKTSMAMPETTLMIGDNYNTDILGAMAVGIDALLFNRWDPTFDPPKKPKYIVKNLKEIMSIL